MAELFTDRLRLLQRLQASPVETALASSAPSNMEISQRAGANSTFKVWLENGHVGYWKPLAGVDERLAAQYGHRGEDTLLHECVAWQLAKRLGSPWSEMVAPPVWRTIDIGGRYHRRSVRGPLEGSGRAPGRSR